MNYDVFTGFKRQPGWWGGDGGAGAEGGERDMLLSFYRLIFDLFTNLGLRKLNNCKRE